VLFVALVCIGALIGYFRVHHVNAEKLVSAEVDLQHFRFCVDQLTLADNLHIKGYILDASNHVKNVVACITSKTQLRAISDAILASPLSVDQTETIKLLHSRRKIAGILVPSLICEINKGKSCEQFYVEERIYIDHNTVLHQNGVTAEAIFNLCRRIGVHYD